MLFELDNLVKKTLWRFSSYGHRVICPLKRREISVDFNPKDYEGRDYSEVKETLNRRIAILLPCDSTKMRVIKSLDTLHRDSRHLTVKEADRVCEGIFRIFGRDYSFPNKINWHKDPVSGYEWPLKYYRSLKVVDLSNSSDIKFPWELNRFKQAVVLGKAYWYTGDEKYAAEFIREIKSWIKDNPINKGINWNCSMEVAIRAINLIWGYCFLIGCNRLYEDFHKLFFNLILAHGEHIFSNLENRALIKGNHYLANLVGLLYISTLFPLYSQSEKWKLFCQKEIIREMDEQVHEDGTSFEGSIPYHRFVTEIFLHAALLTVSGSPSDRSGTSKLGSKEILGYEHMTKLEKMCDFIMSYTKPDGLAPQIGDNDSGRLIRLADNRADINDHRHILAVAGEFFDRDDFRVIGRHHLQDAIWLWGGHIKRPQNDKVIVDSAGYPDMGIYVMRKERDYLIIHCGRLGTGGKGTHTHNDNLSFELCADGATYIVDPGTFTYSGDPEIRNLFRSTEYHNTIMIDGQEQNGLSRTDMFLLEKKCEPRVLIWQNNDDEDFFKGEIVLNSDDGSKFTHSREIHFDRKKRNWKIRDIVSGNGSHDLVWNFHANEGVSIDVKNKYILFKNTSGGVLKMTLGIRHDYFRNVVQGWYSPSYGVKNEAQILRLATRAELPFEADFGFYVN